MSQATIVRYRPGRRCTIRADENRFVKFYGNGAGEQSYANGVQLWRAAQRRELGFLVAEPEGYDRELRAVWQRSVPGAPVKESLFALQGEELARRIGVAAGTLPPATLQPRRLRDRRSELVRSRRRANELVTRVPALAQPVRRFLDTVAETLSACAPAEPRPIHGALHVSQWLENGAELALLDYDSLALGDPELDAATFLADLDVQNRERVAVDRLGAAFLAGYEETAGLLDPRLLAAYRAQRGLEKALRVARTSRPDADRKAERRLDRALEHLEGST